MYVKVRVIAGAKKEFIEEVSAGHFKLSVREPAERNLANRRVVELVAAHYKLPPKQVRIISGHTSPSKILSIPD
ncbi:MAG: DUF167 domain-containing protein [bacterium]|nr:DUF167 domain-containing protein [bacterium]